MKAKGERREAKVRRAETDVALPFRLSTFDFRLLVAAALAVALSGCGTTAKRDTAAKAPPAPRSGGYYLDDGPGANPPADLDGVPDAVPRPEPLHRGTSRPYVVMGRQYTPMTSLQPYRARGIATWYGRRYHGKQTSSGEIYDMYAMTAAHATLPIPSYARVTNLSNGKSVVVRINDRGPFVDGRIVDLSYTAAHRIGVLGGGSAMVEVEAIIPDGTGPTAVAHAPRPAGSRVAAAAAAPVEAPAAGDAMTASRASEPEAQPLPAAEAQPAAAAATQIPIAAESGGYYLQLGAFGSRENAENFLTRMKAQVEWLASALHIFTRDGLFRVHAGPYPNQSEARQTAERIGQALGIKAMVLVR